MFDFLVGWTKLQMRHYEALTRPDIDMILSIYIFINMQWLGVNSITSAEHHG